NRWHDSDERRVLSTTHACGAGTSGPGGVGAGADPIGVGGVGEVGDVGLAGVVDVVSVATAPRGWRLARPSLMRSPRLSMTACAVSDQSSYQARRSRSACLRFASV